MTVTPDVDCYRYVLQAAANRPDEDVVDAVLNAMEDDQLVPDAECYGSAIRAWKGIALLSTEPETCVQKCLDLWDELRLASRRSVEAKEYPILVDYANDVLEALTFSSRSKRVIIAERLFREMETNSELPNPTPQSYTFLLRVHRGQSTKIRDIIKSFLAKIPLFIGDVHESEIVTVFDTYVRLCASTPAQSKSHGLSVLREAIAHVEKVRSFESLSPLSSTYAALLEACAMLLPDGDMRRRLVENVFRLACEEGMVDDQVLNMFRLSASPDQYSRIVLSVSQELEGVMVVPEVWTRVALGGKVRSRDGRKATPLSVGGEVKVTLAMKEYRMRRVREHKNRKLLEGGRLRTKKTYFDPFAKDKVEKDDDLNEVHTLLNP